MSDKHTSPKSATAGSQAQTDANNELPEQDESGKTAGPKSETGPTQGQGNRPHDAQAENTRK